MEHKHIIIGVFVLKKNILSFLEMLKFKYNIKYNWSFVYEIENNEYEYLVTFKANGKDPYLREIPNSTVMHVKNGCIFSINALNKLVEIESGYVSKDYQLDWSKYHNKLIVLSNGNLSLENINKIEDKSVFLS